MGLPKELDYNEAREIALDCSELDANWDVVGQAYEQVFDFICSNIATEDEAYLRDNYYVYYNYLDSKITYNELDQDRLQSIFDSMDAGQARDLFEQYFLCF